MKKLLLTVICILFLSGIASAEFYWRYDTLKNEFGESLPRGYMYYLTEGTFSNYVEKNKEAYVKVIITHNGNVGFFLHEYRWTRAPIYFYAGSIKVKNSNNEYTEFNTFVKWSRQGGLQLKSDDAYEFIRLIRKSVGEVKFVVYDNNNSTYNFVLNANGFIDSHNRMQNYHQLQQKE